ncbi:MAG: FG-GAP-like repeat-containing protein, partial [Ignavibacteria bacterium]
SDQPTFIGRAYIYFGGASMNNTADVTMTGETTNNNFGYSVSSAGDVNDDGYSDVIVGERGYSTNTGRAYLYFGGVSMNNIEDVIMTGETIGNYFGWSVSSAGDVNGDGYSDVIVSAYQYSSSIGRAYIYFGGVSMNNTADVTMTGETTNNYFGISVSSAGDVNGDGYSDVIAGAYGYSSNTGRAYIYTGSAISVKPILISAKDVPNDQGGYLNLKFTKSGFDVPFGEIGGISYQIDRSVPPNINGYQWISVATVLGTYNSFYTAEIHTAYDSGTSGNNTYFFRVTAVSNSNGNFWRSNILSGYSLDNIAPPMVSPFVAAAAGTNVNLNWGSNPAPDFLNYVLFRSVSPVIDPNTSTPLSIVTTTTYTDTSPLSGISYYFIVAQDIHGNFSPVAVTESPSIILNLKMFIEGFYSAQSNSQVSDSITVELRNSTSPFAAAEQTNGVVATDGTVQLKFSVPDGNYYFAVKHRNTIETWSTGAIAFSRTTPVNYDLSSSVLQAYGSNMIQVEVSPVRYAIYSGDINQDGTVDASDVSDADNDSYNSVSGYVRTDVTGDDFVDAGDVSIVDNNAYNSVSVITP